MTSPTPLSICRSVASVSVQARVTMPPPAGSCAAEAVKATTVGGTFGSGGGHAVKKASERTVRLEVVRFLTVGSLLTRCVTIGFASRLSSKFVSENAQYRAKPGRLTTGPKRATGAAAW